jgi:hypothetical protein
MPGVVQHLHLGSAVPGAPLVLGDPEHDAAIAGLGDLRLESQLEVPELLFGDNITRRRDPRKGAIDDLPSVRHRSLAETSPGVGGVTVEQELPSVGAFGRGQPIHFLSG